jgi:hypothetical protein
MEAMRVWAWLLIVSLGACGNSGMTRNFSVSRDEAPDTMAATRVPLSTPPQLAVRPTRPITIGGSTTNPQPATDQAPASSGEEALVEAAGPAPDPKVRAEINQNAGLIYPSPGFVDQLINWKPPSDHAPLINPPGKGGGWFSHIF